VGAFVSAFPLVGAQVVLAILLATLLRANRAAAAALVWISNPVFFYLDYLMGRLLMRVAGIAPAPQGAATLGESVGRAGQGVVLPLMLGAVVFGAACATVAYAVSFYVARRIRATVGKAVRPAAF